MFSQGTRTESISIQTFFEKPGFETKIIMPNKMMFMAKRDIISEVDLER